MNLHNTFGKNRIQLEVGELRAKNFEIGDRIDIPDGLYLGLGGAVMIINRMFVAEFGVIFDKQGEVLDIKKIVSGGSNG